MTEYEYANEISDGAIHTYVTDFNRASPEEMYNIDLYNSNDRYASDNVWWKFTTNLTLQDLAKMDKGRQIRFMKAMWEIYRYRKANA